MARSLTRRRFVQAAMTGVAGASLATHARPARARTSRAASRPNILFLMSDQHRGDALGCDGNSAMHTPNMDRLAAEGARFRQGYSSTPSCTPARAGLLTGLGPWRHGMLGYGRIADRYENEMPRLLGDAGYHTRVIGKCHYSPQRNLHGFHHGLLDESSREQSIDFRSDYRSWFYSEAPTLDPDATGISFNDHRAASYALPERLHPTRWTGDAALQFLRHYDAEQPFLLKVSFARPHSPYDPPRRWMDHYANVDLPAPFVGKWAARNANYGQPYTNELWKGDLGSGQARHSRQGYYGSISFIDEQIGRLLEVLDERNLLENTLVVYTSDHGDMTGDHHYWRKCQPYDGSARVPMLVRWPESIVSATRGQVRDEPTELRDLVPTFLNAAGIDFDPARFDGQSLLDPVRGGNEWRPFIDLEHDVCYGRDNHWSALTDGKTKYIYHALDGEEQLFDLVGDPGELVDLAGLGEHQGTLRKWRSQMLEFLEPRGEPFVRGGNLVPRPEAHRYSPNYPQGSA